MSPSGGVREPARPAAVSGPGALSQRTDGGPSRPTQPVRVPTGGGYGEAKALTEQQQGAPMPAGGPGGAPAAQGGGPAAPGVDIFRPTELPGQTPENSSLVNDPIAEDPQAFLRVLSSKFRHPAILRLLDWSSGGDAPPR